MSAEARASVWRQAERLRINGDAYFGKDRIAAAIDAYTEAIVLNPDVAVTYANRADCFRKQKNWNRVEEDCQKAILLDPNSFKGHYLLGFALLKKEEFAKGIQELEHAYRLGQDFCLGETVLQDIWETLLKAKFKFWEREHSKGLRDLQTLRDACEKALIRCHQFNSGGSNSEHNSEKAAKAHKEQLERLSRVFSKAAMEYQKTTVPDYLCCKISLEIIRDPVVTPSGITYERAMILDHLLKVGKFDPVTKQPLQPNQLVPNFAVKDAVDAFVKQHNWVYGCDPHWCCGSDDE